MSADRRQIDTDLYDAVPHGAYTALGNYRNVKRQNISKYYDPKDGEYQSIFSKMLMELEVISRPEVCPQWARNIVSVINRYAVKWLGPPELSRGAVEEVGAIAMKLLNPDTPAEERLPLAFLMQMRAAEVVRFMHMEDAAGKTPNETHARM